jgi:hypothetical protein
MAFGAGKYDTALTKARKACASTAALLICMNGKKGPGFSCQADFDSLAKLPSILRTVADQTEADMRAGRHPGEAVH